MTNLHELTQNYLSDEDRFDYANILEDIINDINYLSGCQRETVLMNIFYSATIMPNNKEVVIGLTIQPENQRELIDAFVDAVQFHVKRADLSGFVLSLTKPLAGSSKHIASLVEVEID